MTSSEESRVTETPIGTVSSGAAVIQANGGVGLAGQVVNVGELPARSVAVVVFRPNTQGGGFGYAENSGLLALLF